MTTLLLLLACSGGDSKESGDSTVQDSQDTGTDDGCSTVEGKTGTVALSFQMEWDYIGSMDEPPVGDFKGSVFACKDASAVGPVDGATSLLDITVALDLSTSNGDATGVLYTSDPLPAQSVWILGCLDSDANDCDKHDLITRPSENKVVVAPDAETPFTIFFGMLNPS